MGMSINTAVLLLGLRTERGSFHLQEGLVHGFVPLEVAKLHLNPVEQILVVDGFGDKFADTEIHGRGACFHIVSGRE